MKTKIIMGTFIVLVLVSSLYIIPAFTLPSEAVSHWTFDEGSGITAYDSVDTNDGTLIDDNSGNGDGDTPPVRVPGKVGGALDFDGVDDYVDCGTNFGSISTAQALTVEAWIKTTSTETGLEIAGQVAYGLGPWSFHTSIPPSDGEYVGIFFRDTGIHYEGSKYIINDGKWHHVVGTWDGATNKIRLYVDGKLDSEWTETFTMSSTVFPLTIGSNSPGAQRYFFDGLIDEVVIYKRALSFQEIQQNYIENGGNVVLATLGRYWIYNEANIFADTVSGVQTGYLRSRYDISPEGEVDITDATIELETPLTPENFQTENIQPPCIPVFDGGTYTYTWDFGDLLGGQGAMVSLPTNFQDTFDIGFEAQRSWNAVMTSKFVTQTLTIVFTASTEFSNFHNVHVSVQIPNTPEASPTIDPSSVSVSPMLDEREQDWSMWSQTDGEIEVNWGGDPVPGTTYTFSVDVTVENKLFPEPIFYKPAVGFGANFDSEWFFPPDTPPMIDDDINRASGDESTVTYYGSGAFTWQEYAQSEHAITLPWCSFEFSEVFNEIYSKAEGRAVVNQETGFFRGPAHIRINKVSDYVKLSDPEQQTIFWWEIKDYRSRGTAVILECDPIPAPPGSGGGDAGPVPITVTISRFEEGRGVSASGSGVRFAGRITEIELPSP